MCVCIRVGFFARDRMCNPILAGEGGKSGSKRARDSW